MWQRLLISLQEAPWQQSVFGLKRTADVDIMDSVLESFKR